MPDFKVTLVAEYAIAATDAANAAEKVIASIGDQLPVARTKITVEPADAY